MTCILSLDDEPEMLRLFGMILELAGYEHLRTTDSNEALSILRGEPIDLFTQDIMRPEVDGWMLYQLIKQDSTLHHVPVLFISAGWRSLLSRMFLSGHGDEGMAKPFHPKKLLERVKRILERLGKHIPTEEERRTRYEQIRGELAKEFRMSEEQLDAAYKRTTGFLADL